MSAFSSLNSGGGSGAVNGKVLVGGGYGITLGSVNTSGGATGGLFDISNVNLDFSSGTSITFNPAGQVISGNSLVAGALGITIPMGDGDIVIESISATGAVANPISDRSFIRAGRNLLVGPIDTTAQLNMAAGLMNVGTTGSYDLNAVGADYCSQRIASKCHR